MPACQGPGESDLDGNEKDAIGLKCQCSGPSAPILDGVSEAIQSIYVSILGPSPTKTF